MKNSEEQIQTKRKVKNGAKIVIFFAIAATLFLCVSYLVRPVWASDNDYDSTYGFYEEPKNTIETIFLGTSVVERGITPMELYEDYGICAYNLASQNQPMMASYYWLEEAYRLHPETLDTVVLDMSIIKDDFRESSSRYVKAFSGMRLSGVKIRFLRDYSDGAGEFVSNLFSVLSFHDRWKELTGEDFSKFVVKPKSYLLGYEIKYRSAVKLMDSYEEIAIPLYVVEDDEELDGMYEENLEYFDRMVEFCSDHDIQLVLIKTPQLGEHPWSDEAHNTIQDMADQNQLDFIDFNYLPYFDEIDFSFATDAYDNYHLNLSGATKISDWLGAYLSDECGNRDVRGEDSYTFMDQDLEDYLNETQKVISEHMPDYDAMLEEALQEKGVGELTGKQLELYRYDCLCEEVRAEKLQCLEE